MFCSKKALQRLSHKHERYLRLIHENYVSNFIALLVKSIEKLIHQGFYSFPDTGL